MLNLTLHLRIRITVAAALGLTAVALSEPPFAGLQRQTLETAVNEKIDVAVGFPTTLLAANKVSDRSR